MLDVYTQYAAFLIEQWGNDLRDLQLLSPAVREGLLNRSGACCREHRLNG